VRLFNLQPNAQGVVRVPRSQLGAHHSVLLVVAVDGHSSAVIKQVALQPVALPSPVSDSKQQADALALHPAYTDTRLLPGLLPTKHWTEQSMVSVLRTGESKQVEDIRTATVETFETIQDAWALYNTLAKERGGTTPSLLTQFNFVMQWPKLSAEKKAEKYSEYSCHELNFFIYHKGTSLPRLS
jgi:hypothetical protein